VERVISYTNLEPEPGYNLQKKPPGDWPTEARIKVKDVSLCVLQRRTCSQLRDLNLSFGAEEKLGIAGRTGAGHYEWFACHFRQFYIKLKLKVRFFCKTAANC